MRQNSQFDDRESLCGRTLGDYEILRRVGGGATSDVFLARQKSLGRNVALKILKDELAADATYVKRFEQEARAAAKLEHPNVVRIYEIGELVADAKRDSWRERLFASSKRRRAGRKTYRFIAQEYVDGMSLAQYLRRNGVATIMQVFAALEQIGSALKRASDFNLVHRDVKPENVILDAYGAVKVVDFGLARPIETNDATWTEPSLTRTGVALGTPLYMSPEQARGQRLDARSDVYSLGATAYRMLTGVAPFKGETPLAVVLKHLSEKPRPILELRPDAPPALAALVERMLEKNPDDRPESPDALLKELARAKKEYLDAATDRDDPIDATLDERSEPSSDASDAVPNLESDGFEIDLAARKSDSDATPNVVSTKTSFFQNAAERAAFERGMATTALSQEWRANRIKLDETLRAQRAGWSRGAVATLLAVMLVSFTLGVGALLVRNAIANVPPTEPPLAIQRFDSVEEQYVFALQSGTLDAWKSVVEYFPNEEYWKTRAKRQIALLYVNDRDVDAAEKVFDELENRPELGVEEDPFALAGAAWVAAMRKDDDAATAALSRLGVGVPIDRSTESLVARTREILHRRNGGAPNPPGFPFRKDDARGRFPGGAPNGGVPGAFRNPGAPGETKDAPRQNRFDRSSNPGEFNGFDGNRNERFGKGGKDKLRARPNESYR